MTCSRWLLTILVSLATIASLAGCGSGDGTEPPTTSISSGDAGAAGQSATEKPLAETLPTVRIETSLGNFVVQLDRKKAPLTVENFLSYVKRGHYDGTIFHQIVDSYIVLGGGYTPELVEKPTETPVRNEAHNGLKNTRGTIAMARQADSIDSSTCQFFINLADNETLDHQDRTVEDYGYCAFGTVIEGMEVVEKISKVPVHDTEEFQMIATRPVVITSVTRVH